MLESKLRGKRSDGFDDGDIPPTVTCAICRRTDCGGCEPGAPLPQSAMSLAWEGGDGHWMRRLWFTALASSTQPLRTFGALPDGRLGPALVFALLAEILAIGSVGCLLALCALAVDPGLSARILTTPSFCILALALVLGLSLIMVGLHLAWGICLELGARRTGTAHFRHGMRFGLYACGWDLLTSPAGVLEGLLSRGFVDAWHPILAAVRVPGVALRAYLQDCRHLDLAAQRRGTRLSIAVLGGIVLLILTAVLMAIVSFSDLIGY
jgi:hypothetical protein